MNGDGLDILTGSYFCSPTGTNKSQSHSRIPHQSENFVHDAICVNSSDHSNAGSFSINEQFVKNDSGHWIMPESTQFSSKEEANQSGKASTIKLIAEDIAHTMEMATINRKRRKWAFVQRGWPCDEDLVTEAKTVIVNASKRSSKSPIRKVYNIIPDPVRYGDVSVDTELSSFLNEVCTMPGLRDLIIDSTKARQPRNNEYSGLNSRSNKNRDINTNKITACQTGDNSGTKFQAKKYKSTPIIGTSATLTPIKYILDPLCSDKLIQRSHIRPPSAPLRTHRPSSCNKTTLRPMSVDVCLPLPGPTINSAPAISSCSINSFASDLDVQHKPATMQMKPQNITDVGSTSTITYANSVSLLQREKLSLPVLQPAKSASTLLSEICPFPPLSIRRIPGLCKLSSMFPVQPRLHQLSKTQRIQLTHNLSLDFATESKLLDNSFISIKLCDSPSRAKRQEPQRMKVKMTSSNCSSHPSRSNGIVQSWLHHSKKSNNNSSINVKLSTPLPRIDINRR